MLAPGGNVGVGTALPARKLDVTGDIRASGTICDSTGCINQKVIWHAYNGGTRFASGARMVYPNVTVNAGGAYNTTTGIATIPVSGIHRLCTYTITSQETGSVYMDLYVNGLTIQAEGGRVYTHAPTTGFHQNLGGCHIRQLSAGDAVEWRSMNLGVYGAGTYSYMSGELL